MKIQSKTSWNTFKTRTGCYFELLRPEIIKLLGNTEIRINRDTNGENVPYLESTKNIGPLQHC